MSRAERFNARQYFLSTARWFNDWPSRAIEQFEAKGFTGVRIERISPHPVYRLRLRVPPEKLSSKQAGSMIRKVVEQAGTIPRGGFFCSADRQGRIEAAFVLDA